MMNRIACFFRAMFLRGVILVLSAMLAFNPIPAQAQRAVAPVPAKLTATSAPMIAAQPRKKWSKAELRQLAENNASLQGFRIGVDAGGGGDAPLQLNPNLSRVDVWTRVAEARLNLRIAEALQKELQKLGAQVISLSAAPGVRPEQRLSRARGKGLDLVISIQHSYSIHAQDNLTAAYYSPADDTAAEITARRMNQSLSLSLGLPATGALAAPKPLAGLEDTPVALVICSLLSNPDEFIHSMDQDYAEHQARAIAQGLVASVRERAGLLEKGAKISHPLPAPAWRERAAQLAKLARSAAPAASQPLNLPSAKRSTEAPPVVPPPAAVLESSPVPPQIKASEDTAQNSDWSQALQTFAAPTPEPSAQAKAKAVAGTPPPILSSATPLPAPPLDLPSATPMPAQMPASDSSGTESPQVPAEVRSGTSVDPFQAIFPRPMNAPVELTWLFGEVYDPAVGMKRGVSFEAPAGSPVRAVADGRVIEASYDSNPSGVLPYGHAVLIEHTAKLDGKPVYTVYGQLAEVLAAKGNAVKAGQVIGKSGKPFDLSVNDRSTEIEFEIWIGDLSPSEARNPELYIQPYAKSTGLIVGRVVDAQGQLLPRQEIHGARKSPDLYSLSYDASAKSSDWRENFAIGDVPAGTYTLTVPGIAPKTVSVQAGKITNVVLQKP